MMSIRLFVLGWLWLPVVLLAPACARKADDSCMPARTGGHEHHAPHGGTAVVLGADAYHLEFVRDPVEGTLSAFVLDGELESFIRISAQSFEVMAIAGDKQHRLVLQAQRDSSTGEEIGDTAVFVASADWLKTTDTFDGVLTTLVIRGTTYTAVPFNFPRGNEDAGEDGLGH